MKPKNVDVINNFLAIAWDDGGETFVEMERLRRACPCAMCKGETNVLSYAPPTLQNFTAKSFELTGWEFVGGYAIQPKWADGHASGLYSFDYLRKMEGTS
jgi:DUF971 family protein